MKGFSKEWNISIADESIDGLLETNTMLVSRSIARKITRNSWDFKIFRRLLLPNYASMCSADLRDPIGNERWSLWKSNSRVDDNRGIGS